jgi:hypothetical protein
LPSNETAKQDYCHPQFVELYRSMARELLFRGTGAPGWRKSTKETTMARIDQQAARKELQEASELRAKAAQLVEIAGELEQEAERHENDAVDLTAPAKKPVSSTRSRR